MCYWPFVWGIHLMRSLTVTPSDGFTTQRASGVQHMGRTWDVEGVTWGIIGPLCGESTWRWHRQVDSPHKGPQMSCTVYALPRSSHSRGCVTNMMMKWHEVLLILCKLKAPSGGWSPPPPPPPTPTPNRGRQYWWWIHHQEGEQYPTYGQLSWTMLYVSPAWW